MTFKPRPFARSVIAGLAICGLAGCLPLPIAHTDLLSPPVVGTYRRSDGTPVAGATVAIARNPRDGCRAITARVTTDSTGAFRLPGTQARHRWLLVTLMEFVQRNYVLCVGTSDSLEAAYTGSFPLYAKQLDETRAECLAWEWQGRAGTTCDNFLQGGEWADSAGRGSYRVIFTREAPVEGRSPGIVRPRILVQWVREAGAGSPAAVASTMALPVDDRFVRADMPELWPRDGGWEVIADCYEPTWQSPTPIVFELGGPGQVRKAQPR